MTTDIFDYLPEEDTFDYYSEYKELMGDRYPEDYEDWLPELEDDCRD